MVKPAARREGVAYLQKSYPVSGRRACQVLGLSRGSWWYRAKGRDDGALREALRTSAAKRRRWGYRMLTRVLRREGFEDNHKRISRVYREEGLQVMRRKKRKTRKWRGEKPKGAQGLHQRWSIDFVSDQLAGGRKLRMLTVVDDFSRQCLGIEVDTSLSGERVCRVLDRLVLEHGRPQRIVMDNGPEFTGKALDQWAYEHQVELQFIEPGRPVQNAFVESFNGTLRNECLNEHWFVSLADTRRLVESWRIDYNQVRPHSSLGDRTPAEFAALHTPRGVQIEQNKQQTNLETFSLTLAQ